jgi:hypothetical protein
MRVEYIFAALAIVIAVGICSFAFPEGVGAIVVVSLGSAVALPIFRKTSSDGNFILKIFFAGLAVRLVFGLLIYLFQAQEFFGPDAIGYDYKGLMIADYWRGLIQFDTPFLTRAMATSGTGWGMNYLVGAIYFVGGRNPLAAMALCCVVGGLIGPAVHNCAHKIFKNTQVARVAAIMTAFFPAFIIWSAQLIKDGLIIFLLVVTILAVLKLQEKFSIGSLAILVLAMFGILSLRFYIFYMLAIAVVGTFVIGLSNTPGSIARRTAVLIIVGFGLTYLGVLRTATIDLEEYGNLERLQRSRLDLARSGESGFAEDVDVSTTEGALSAIPVGFAYLMFAPFPWQATNLRQAITLPEVLLWWAMMPLMISGIIYTIRNRLREAFPALLFSLMLTFAYSIFQGNVGTAYRQRTQIQVFLFMFIAVGWVLRKEAKENKQIVAKARRHQITAPTGQV